MFQVMIIEDDPMVASIDRKYTEAVEGFRVTGVFKNGAEALETLKTKVPDLIILDYFTPVMNGDEFLDRMHTAGIRPDVIMVTSANSADIVRALLSRGVCDYLVKPFEFERFRDALERFRNRRKVLADGPGLQQKEIDRILSAGQPAQGGGAALPKGMNEKTLELIRAFFRNNAETLYTGEAAAEQVGLSRITVRRYVSYLVEQGELKSEIDYQTGGRPGILYKYVNRK